MKFLDLFAGIGGFRSGLERAGMECAGYVECDPYCSRCKEYTKHMPTREKNVTVCIYCAKEKRQHARDSYEAIHDTKGEWTGYDITTITNDDFRVHRGFVDIITGGFPCQSFSLSGNQGGFEDTRGTMFFEIARAAKEIQPRFLFLENVRNLIHHDKGRTFATILATLHELGYGHIEWGIFNTKLWAVPQNRERVFIMAERRNNPTRPYLLDLLKQQESNGVTARLRDVLESDVDEKFYLSEEKTAKLVEMMPDRIRVKEATVKGYADAFPGDTVNLSNPKSKTRRGRVGSQVANTLLTGQEQAVIESTDVFASLNHYGNEQMNRVYGVDGQAPSIIAVSGGGREPKIAEPNRKEVVTPRTDDVTNCLTVSQSIEQTLLEVPNYRIRRLTPLECWRLQDFTDEQFDKARAAGMSDTQLYKQAGNSVTVKVIEVIGRELKRRVDEER